MNRKKIKLLIVDDSAIIRKILSEELGKHPEIEIIGTAPDPFIARDKIVHLNPDVITLDIEMPRMDGITFLEKLMKSRPLPVIVLSTLTPKGCELALRAFELGALDVIHKPELDVSFKLNEMIGQLVEKIHAGALAKTKLAQRICSAAPAPPRPAGRRPLLNTTDKVVAIGASTGGTEAIRAILPALPADFPGTVIAQHMPAHFTKSFADHLDSICAMEVREAREGDAVRPGLALIAPGNFHMLVRRSGARYHASVQTGPMVHHQRPAVDVLFSSVARSAGHNAIGVILTGMGKDGAEGLMKMKDTGARTIGQDEKSCVVFGMPKVAIETGAVDFVTPLSDIPDKMIQLLS